ncbi:fatty acid desaturase [Neisseriaceae bacterium CLB008]|nr:fatty acid desaturase [Neisseriaceae bacterium]
MIMNGLFDLPWYGVVLVTLGLTHITIASVTIYLHRSQAHRGVDLHPVVSHFFRFWLWLTTGMVTKEWVAIHRKHHARCETAEDPHSPQVLGLKAVLWRGAELYRVASKNPQLVEQFGKGTPDDWVERNIYTKHSGLGIFVMLAINLLCFGLIGITIWAIQMVWIPFWAAGVVNGIGHFFGYRNFENEDAATNLVPWGIIIGGEELHNNHHTFGSSAKFSYHWYEFDLGWMYISIMKFFGLAKVRKVAPKLAQDAHHVITAETVQAIIHNRYLLATRFAKELKSDYLPELEQIKCKLDASLASHNLEKLTSKLFKKEAIALNEQEHSHLQSLLSHSHMLQKIYAMRQELSTLWQRSSFTQEELLFKLKDWCDRAETSGIESLARYAQSLKAAKLA